MATRPSASVRAGCGPPDVSQMRKDIFDPRLAPKTGREPFGFAQGRLWATRRQWSQERLKSNQQSRPLELGG